MGPEALPPWSPEAPLPIFGGLLRVALDLPPPDVAPLAEIEAKGKKGKHTYQPNVLHRKRTHGILSRLRTPGGRNTIRRRREKGRWKIAVT